SPVARGRAAHGPGAPEPRLPGRPRGRLPGLRHLHPDQSRRGSSLWMARSPDAPGERDVTARQLRRHGLGILGLLVASLAVLVALAAPWPAPHDSLRLDLAAGLRPPGPPRPPPA